MKLYNTFDPLPITIDFQDQKNTERKFQGLQSMLKKIQKTRNIPYLQLADKRQQK